MDWRHKKFLKKSIYGDEPARAHSSDSAVHLLDSRYQDHDIAAVAFRPRGESPLFQPPDSFQSPLPSPFNLGEKWDGLALAFMKEDLRNAEDLEAQVIVWSRF